MGISTHTITCSKCGKEFKTLFKSVILCKACSEVAANEKKLNWFEKRRFSKKENREKTLEERVAWLENWIYENKEKIEESQIKDDVLF